MDEDAYVLSQYEIATFLAYTYTGSTPDDILLTAADNNELMTDLGIQSQINRLLASDKARDHFGEFAAQWLHTDQVLSVTKSTEQFPDFTQDVRAAMAQEVREIFKHVMFDDNQPVTNIFSDFSFLNSTLADFYGVGGANGNNFVKVSNLGERGGVLTSGAFMSGFANDLESSPIQRAVSVREDILCQPVPPMPTDIDLFRDDAAVSLAEHIEAQGGSITNRERFAFLTKDAPCSQCHDEIINPHGFGMENFDAVGRLRDIDAEGNFIDSSGELIGTYELDDGNVETFDGAVALSSLLAELPVTTECFAEKSFRFVMGTGHDVFDGIATDAPDLESDEIAGYSCSLESMNAAMGASNNNAQAAFRTLGTRDIVRYRRQR